MPITETELDEALAEAAKATAIGTPARPGRG